MEQFIVSARKYRPDTFESLIGQENIARTLKNSIMRGQLAHAYLFCGPRGVGKTTTARIFAKSINCLNPDAASNNSVDDIRNLTDMVRIPPQVGKYSVYIIDEVHMLSSAAFNAFLKTLEEPPAHAIFILATTEKHKILPTILSRCQTFDFNRISVPDIVRNLTDIASKEGISIDSESLHVIAVKADGAMRDALTIFDQIVAFCGRDVHYEDVIRDLNVLDYEYYFKIIDNSLAGDYMSSLLLFDEILSKGFNALYFVSGLSSHLRDLLVCRNSSGSALLSLPPSLIERYREQAARCSVQFIFSSLNITMNCEASYRQSGNQRLLIEFALMRMAEKTQTAQQPGPVQTAPAAVAPETQEAVPQQPPKSIAKLPGLSLKTLISKAEKQENADTSGDTSSLTDEPLTFESMMNAWQALADQEKASGRSALATAMLHHSPGIDIDAASLIFFVSNGAQQEWIREKALMRMEAALRKALRNSKVKIDVQLYESPDGKKEALPYMPVDKAKYMAAKQPELGMLVKDLDLDVK